jgi:hypothetical protein
MKDFFEGYEKVVLNLPHRRDRKQKLTQVFQENGIENYRWFQPIRRNEIGDYIRTHANRTIQAEKSCTHAHLSAAVSTPHAKLVMEDDVRFPYLQEYRDVFSEFKNLASMLPKDLEVLQIDVIVDTHMYERRKRSNHWYIPWERGMWSCACMFYTERGIEKIKTWFDGPVLDVSFEKEYFPVADAVIYHNLNSYSLTLPIAAQERGAERNNDIRPGEPEKLRIHHISHDYISDLWSRFSADFISNKLEKKVRGGLEDFKW